MLLCCLSGPCRAAAGEIGSGVSASPSPPALETSSYTTQQVETVSPSARLALYRVQSTGLITGGVIILAHDLDVQNQQLNQIGYSLTYSRYSDLICMRLPHADSPSAGQPLLLHETWGWPHSCMQQLSAQALCNRPHTHLQCPFLVPLYVPFAVADVRVDPAAPVWVRVRHILPRCPGV